MVFGRRHLVALTASAGLLAVSAVVAPRVVHATPGPSGATCTLSGNANLSPGLTNSSQQFSYNFSGTLSNCVGSDSSAPTSGAVTAGTPIVIGGITYQLPIPSGTGGCTSSMTSGISVITWGGNASDVTLTSYTTTGALAAVALQGSVIPSLTLTAVVNGVTHTATITTTRYAGDTALAPLVFHPADPTQCNGAGVTLAPIDGQIGVGTVATS